MSNVQQLQPPRIILGTMTMGGQTKEEVATEMIQDFCSNPQWTDLVKENPMLDTAIMYVNGETEVILGRILKKKKKELPNTLSIATKANPFTKDKNLSPAGVRKQLETSLQSLQVDKVDIFYLHAPDVNHPIEPTLEEIQKLFLEDKFNKFALSNFSAWEVVYIHAYMKSHQYILPTIYQGMYNAITRQVETELLPALRKCNIAFYAYNPLGGGMLTGKYTTFLETDAEAAREAAKFGNRFAGNTFWAKSYRQRYQQKEQYVALEVVRDALAAPNENENNNKKSPMADASLRWLRYHSKLGPNDGIIVGASTMEHFVMNMESLAAGPISEDIVSSFKKASKLCQSVCPNYQRGHSGAAVS